MNTIVLPTSQQCQEFWDQYKTPLHIREHMRQVNRVGVYIAGELIRCGEHVILDLVDRATLLHDTVRVTEWDRLSFEYFPYTPSSEEISAWEEQRRRWNPSVSHASINEEIFRDVYPEMAHVIGLHNIRSTQQLRTWEEKIVNYADRRVAHSCIVTIAERLEEGYARYLKTSKNPMERDPALVEAIYRIEREIFSRIGGDPDRLPL